MILNEVLTRISLVVATTILISACATEPTIPQGANAENSFDGLTKVENSTMHAVWVKPGLDLGEYSKILPMGAGIDYRAVDRVSRAGARSSGVTEFPLDEVQRQKIAALVSDVFREELSKSKHYAITDKAAPDTLTIIGKLMDVVSNVPPEPMGRGDIYLSQVGEATLALEIRDSQSNEIFLRAIDRRALKPNFVRSANPVTNSAELRKEIRRWATMLREGLDQFHDM
jgi:hypothetical protein